LDVLAAPGSGERVTLLPQDAQVRVTGEAAGPDGSTWYAIQLWNAVNGYVRRDALAFTAAPDKPPGADAAPWKPAQPPAQGPFPIQARGTTTSAIDYAGSPDGAATGRLPAGTSVQVASWATDGQGRIWFQFSGAGSGWVLAAALPLDVPPPAAAGDPRLNLVSGKGMWFTYDTLRTTPAAHLVAAAQANGFTFLAPEVGTSRRGYWADSDLDALLPLAHAAGLKVIPWVYPWLADVPADLQLALAAARHVAPSGDRVDGLAVDLEENLDEATNRTYGELLRVSLGADPLLVAIVFQPQIASGRRTPYAALAKSYDVIAPMSYWHGRPISYGYQDAYDYVAESVRLIRERAGRANVPVAVLGQTFDWFSRNEIGPGNPTGDEMRGALQAARDAGALGMGFFNWYSTTPDEWDALQAFAW
jgi:hypothetical protein